MRIKTPQAAFATALILCGLANGQSSAFEVASVKAHRSAPDRSENAPQSIEAQPGTVTIRNASLNTCIKWAFLVKDYQISGPAWLLTDRFDIAAKAAGPAPDDELRRMLQTLLRERFKLQAHRETRERAVYALKVAKSGPKLHNAEPGGHTAMRVADGSFVFDSVSMPAFADDLATFSQVDRPVLDRTGIQGVFDLRLKFGESAAEMKRALVAGDGVSLFTLIQEQLGLRLEAQNGPVEMLVIDRVARAPAEN